MEILVIVLVVVGVIVLLIRGILFLKKKIQHKAIDIAAGAVKKTAENYLDKETANKVNKGIDFTADIAKGGTTGLVKQATTTMLDEETAKTVNKAIDLTAGVADGAGLIKKGLGLGK